MSRIWAISACSIALVAVFGFCPSLAAGPILTGRVLDQTSRAPLAGAAVVAVSGETAVTGQNGRFSLQFSATGDVTIEVSQVGYTPLRVSARVTTGANQELEILLPRISEYTSDVVVTAPRVLETETVQVLPPDQVAKLPGGGEDVLQVMKYLPGVVGGDDWSGRLYVRGGRPDQNGIYLDGIPIYDPYRLFGFTSLFNPETLEAITLYPGGFDVRYGDRLSAVIAVENRTGDEQRLFSANANVNLTNANLIAEGKLPLGFPSSWLFSARRTYYDMLLRQFDANNSSFPAFTDAQARLLFQPWAQHRWTVTLIGCEEGTDLYVEEKEEYHESESQVSADDRQRDYVAGAQGKHMLGNLLWDYVLSETRSGQKSEFSYIEGDTAFKSSFDQDLVCTVDSLRSGLELGLGRHSLFAGGDIATSRNTVTFALRSDDPRFDIPDALKNFDVEQDFTKRGAYLQDKWDVTPELELKAGVRWDHSTLSGMSATSPRASLRWHSGTKWEVRAGWGHYYQFPSYETLQGDGYFLDLRGIRDLELKPEFAVHHLLGGSYNSGAGWEIAIDLYHKTLRDLLASDTEIRTELVLDDNDRAVPYEREAYNFLPVNKNKGYAQGIDVLFMLKQGPERPYHGMIAYTYGRAKSKADGEPWYWERRDRRHSLTVVGGWTLGQHWDVSWKWSLGTGFPYTPVTNVIRIVEDLDGDGRYEPEQGEGFFYQRDDPEEVYRSERFPTYHRLDVRGEYHRVMRGIDWTFYLDIINLYSQTNVYDYSYNDDYTKREEIDGLPFLPSVGIKAWF